MPKKHNGHCAIGLWHIVENYRSIFGYRRSEMSRQTFGTGRSSSAFRFSEFRMQRSESGCCASALEIVHSRFNAWYDPASKGSASFETLRSASVMPCSGSGAGHS